MFFAPEDQRPVAVRTLLSDSAILGVGGLLDPIIGFVLLPLTAVLLGTEGFGVLGLFNTTFAILSVIALMGMRPTFFRFYTAAKTREGAQEALGAAVTISVAAALLLCIPTLIWSTDINRGIFGMPGKALVVLLCVRVFSGAVSGPAVGRLKADGRAPAVLAINVVKTIVSRGVGLTLLVAGFGVVGLMLGGALGAGLHALLGGVVAFRGVALRVDRKTTFTMLPFGASLVPAGLSALFLRATDKYLLRFLSPDPLVQVGLYSLGERFSRSTMDLFSQVALGGWNRFSFGNMNFDTGPHRIAKAATLYAVVSGYVALVVALLGDDLVHWLIGGDFEAATVIIPILTLAFYFSGLAPLFQPGLVKAREPLRLSAITTTSALLNVGLNLVLIPRYGFWGAAVATLVSQILNTVLLWRQSQRAYPLPFGYRRLIIAGTVFAVAYIVGTSTSVFGWLAASLGQLAIVALVPFVLYGTGFVAGEELAFVHNAWKTLKRDIYNAEALSLNREPRD